MAKKRFNYSDFCQSCRSPLDPDSKIVYVEESTNRFFCSEKCIRTFYDPMADYYKKRMLEIRDPHDIPETDFPQYESYAPLCLAHPDEVWGDSTENGESVYYFMANYTNEGGKFTYIVMSFCMELEPTYIVLSFPTRDKKLVEEFRKGQQIELQDETDAPAEPEADPVLQEDFLAKQGNAIEEEMLRHRRATDVPKDEFEEYSHLLDHTIENPDEVWELQDEGENTLLTLISQQDDKLHYVVICVQEQNAENQEAWKVIYSFPTNDPALVQRYRRGVMREGADPKTAFLH